MEGMVDAKALRREHAGQIPDTGEGQCGWDRVHEGQMETKDGREAARGLGDQGQRVDDRAMRSHKGHMSRGGLWFDSGFSAEPEAAVGRNLVWARGWDSIHQEAVGVVGMESGQGSPVPIAVAPYSNQPHSIAPFQGPHLDLR